MKKESSSKKTNTFALKRVFKRIIAINISLVIVISFCIGAAYASNNINNELYLMSTNEHCQFFVSGNVDETNYNSFYWEFWNTTPDVDVYCMFGTNWIGPSGIRKSGPIFISLDNFVTRLSGYSGNNPIYQNVIPTTIDTRTSNNDLFYRCIPSVQQSITYLGSNPASIPVIDFIDCANEPECWDYLYELLTTAPSPEPVNGNNLIYSLPAGNVAFIEIGTAPTHMTLYCTMPVKNALFSTGNQWSTTQHYGTWELDLPPNGYNLSTFGTEIPWQVSETAPKNLVGQTNEAQLYYLLNEFETHKYAVIVNPLYYAVQYSDTTGSIGQTVNNGSIRIACDNAISIHVFSLTQSVTINDNEATYENGISSGEYTGTVDPDTGDVTWTDPSGGSSSPQQGGGNIVSTGETSFKNWLDSLAQRIVDIFQPAHDAINVIANAINNFSSYMYALYTWLPSPVLSVLTSAITLAIVIGVVKVFI